MPFCSCRLHDSAYCSDLSIFTWVRLIILNFTGIAQKTLGKCPCTAFTNFTDYLSRRAAYTHIWCDTVFLSLTHVHKFCVAVDKILTLISFYRKIEYYLLDLSILTAWKMRKNCSSDGYSEKTRFLEIMKSVLIQMSMWLQQIISRENHLYIQGMDSGYLQNFSL